MTASSTGLQWPFLILLHTRNLEYIFTMTAFDLDHIGDMQAGSYCPVPNDHKKKE
jgi:hypothetical protein